MYTICGKVTANAAHTQVKPAELPLVNFALLPPPARFSAGKAKRSGPAVRQGRSIDLIFGLIY